MAPTTTPDDFPDKTRAILRAPLHVLMSITFAAATVVVPSVGDAYVAWRQAAEDADFKAGRDSAEKAHVDLVTQTALVRAALWLRGR